MVQLSDVQDSLKQFVLERGWNQYDKVSFLLLALVGEVGELCEIFQWKNEKELEELKQFKQEHIQEEMADVFLYLLRLSSVLDVDLLQASLDKIKKNSDKYPVDKFFGSAKKYDEK